MTETEFQISEFIGRDTKIKSRIKKEVIKMSKLHEIAKRANTLSELMNNREKISTEDIKKYYPNGIHINQVDFMEKDNKTVTIATFTEDNTKFFFGGTIITNIFSAVLMNYEGDIGEINKDLKKEPLHIKITSGTNSKGQPLNKVDIIE